jgi:hypothetical protein
MRKRLAAIAVPLACVWLLSAAAAHADRNGPPAVGAGTGRLTLPVLKQAGGPKNRTKTLPAAAKSNSGSKSSERTASTSR